MSVFMLYDGVDGEHVVGGDAGLIQLESMSWGLSRSTASVTPSLRSRSEPSLSEIVCTKEVDGSSIGLMNEVLTGKFDRTIIIKFYRQGAEGPLVYLSYTLEEAGISSLQQSGGSAGTPQESFSLNFSSIAVCHTIYQDDLTGIPSFAFYSVPDGG